MIVLRSLVLSASLFLAIPTLAHDVPTKAPAFDPEALLLLDDAEMRAPSIEALQATLYDLIALCEAAHQEHWNVVEVEFYQLHDFYQHLYEDVDAQVDIIAERILALGAPADGRPSAVGASALLEESAPEFQDDEATLALLLSDWDMMASAMYDRMDAVEEDLSTQDTLIDVSRSLDKQLWMIRAHLREGVEE